MGNGIFNTARNIENRRKEVEMIGRKARMIEEANERTNTQKR